MTDRNQASRGTVLGIAKSVAIVLTGLVCMALFAGCGEGSKGGVSQESDNPAVANSSDGTTDLGESSEPSGDQAAAESAEDEPLDVTHGQDHFPCNLVSTESAEDLLGSSGEFSSVDALVDPSCDVVANENSASLRYGFEAQDVTSSVSEIRDAGDFLEHFEPTNFGQGGYIAMAPASGGDPRVSVYSTFLLDGSLVGITSIYDPSDIDGPQSEGWANTREAILNLTKEFEGNLANVSSSDLEPKTSSSYEDYPPYEQPYSGE